MNYQESNELDTATNIQRIVGKWKWTTMIGGLIIEEFLENIYLPCTRHCLNLRDRNYGQIYRARGRVIATAISLKLLDNCIITYVIPSGVKPSKTSVVITVCNSVLHFNGNNLINNTKLYAITLFTVITLLHRRPRYIFIATSQGMARSRRGK